MELSLWCMMYSLSVGKTELFSITATDRQTRVRISVLGHWFPRTLAQCDLLQICLMKKWIDIDQNSLIFLSRTWSILTLIAHYLHLSKFDILSICMYHSLSVAKTASTEKAQYLFESLKVSTTRQFLSVSSFNLHLYLNYIKPEFHQKFFKAPQL